jgi:hypothetical protein
MNKLIFTITAILSLLLFPACGSDDDNEAALLTSITISPVDKDLYIGDTYQLTISHQPADIKLPKLTWTSSDTKIAAVSGSGLVEAKADGVATITVAYGDLLSTVILIILNQDIELTFNEPLPLFGKSKEDTRKTERRKLETETERTLLYKDSKGNLNYNILYTFNDVILIKSSIFFDNTQKITMHDVAHELEKKYDLLSFSGGYTFYNNDTKRMINVIKKTDNSITIEY